MNTLKLSVVKSRTDTYLGNETRDVVDFLIDGRNLIDIVREIEQPFADGEGHPDIAGEYEGLPAEVTFLPSRHLLGDAHEWYESPSGEAAHKIVLLRCGSCGSDGCWPLLVKITATEGSVIWSDFEQPHRNYPELEEHKRWRYDGLGPFIFDRRQYEAELASHSA